jgi:hypothetical protein
MKYYIKRYLFVVALLSVYGLQTQDQQESKLFDVVADCQYPMFGMQPVREALSQAVYFLQQNNDAQCYKMLESALADFATRQKVSDDDRQFIQNMIDKINALIESLESSDRSAIADLCQQLKAKL